jgi:nucleotide-binding universal stress UspA family protein
MQNVRKDPQCEKPIRVSELVICQTQASQSDLRLSRCLGWWLVDIRSVVRRSRHGVARLVGEREGSLLIADSKENNMLRILIAVDGSDHANRAIGAAGTMAKSSLDLEAILLCVSPEPIFYGDYTLATIQRIEADQKVQQDTILAKATESAKAQGLKLGESARAHGVIANEIVRIANERKVDQIVMGTRGMGAVGNMMLGSVTQRVVHQSSVPVLLVK